MNDDQIHGILKFLRDAEALKNTLRNSTTSKGRHESTAEHTWRLCLIALLFEKQFPDINTLKLIKICIIHDLGEAINGDIPAIKQDGQTDKGAQERADLVTLLTPLDNELQADILSLWDEYDHATSQEAKLAKAFDKIETILQHTQGKNPSDFNYEFNLSYGKKYTDLNKTTARLRAIIDADTKFLAENRENP